MDVKDAVKVAVSTIADVFAGESPSNLGLEEVSYLDGQGVWKVTVGFSRPWDYEPPSVLSPLASPRKAARQFKVVEVGDEDGKVRAIRIRE